MWKDNRRRHDQRISTQDVLHRYDDYKLAFVGDASMSPYETIHPGGDVEYWNEEPGTAWLQRLTSSFPNAIWLNPLSSSMRVLIKNQPG